MMLLIKFDDVIHYKVFFLSCLFSRYYTLSEHSAEQRKQHRLQLAELNPRGSSSEETDSDEEPTESSSDADSEAFGFLQPVSAKQRRALLKAAGVRKVDPSEKDECRLIRTSREVCGCTCRVYCDPETCSCSQGGIKCQVDRQNFPCGCTRDGCGNTTGRVEFNPVRVRTHYIHTVMRLEMEKKQEKMQVQVQPSTSFSTTDGAACQPQVVVQPPQEWRVPAHNMSMVDFNLLYSANQSPPSARPPDALDLQYAFRDDYSPTAIVQPSYPYEPCSYPGSGQNTYMEPVEPAGPPPSFDPTHHFPALHSYDTAARLSPATPTGPVYDSHYVYYPDPTKDDVAVASTSYINLGPPISSNSATTINTVLDSSRFTNNPTIQLLPELPGPTEEEPTGDVVAAESNESNLSEIIKKSIVETVSV